MPLDKGQAIRIRLTRPQMLLADRATTVGNGASWTPDPRRQGAGAAAAADRDAQHHRSRACQHRGALRFNPGLLHRIVDPDAGDTLLVVTALPPVRGFIKRQDFVDFALLDSAHGIAIRPNSDDVGVEVGPGKVIVGKPGGLTLSSADIAAERAPIAVRPLFDLEELAQEPGGAISQARQNELITATAECRARRSASTAAARSRPVLHGARLCTTKPRAVTEFLMLADPATRSDEPVPLMVHAVASILMRPARRWA